MIFMKSSVIRSLALAIVGFAIGSFVIGNTLEEPHSAHTLEADFWYDTSDPSQILGEAPFAALVTVEGTAGVDLHSGRTLYNLRLEHSLQGSLPTTFQASQLGYVESGVTKSLEGFPLLQVGRSYLVAFTTPGSDDPQNALVILTGPDGGNAIQVQGLEDRAGKAFIDGLTSSRSPYVDSKSRSDLEQSIQAWTSSRAGFTPTRLPGR